MLAQGTVRLGTLHEFRDTESHGDEVGDQAEGKKWVFEQGRRMSYDQPSSISDFAATFIGRRGPPRVLFDHNTLEVEQGVPDCFVYCVTEEFSERAMRECGYDACIELVNSQAFFNALDADLRRRDLVGDWNVCSCEYKPRRRTYDPRDTDHPALLKEPRYSYQKEVRGIWEPRHRPVRPLILHVPQLTPFLREYAPRSER